MRYHGRDGALYMSANLAGTPTQAVSMTRWTIDMTQDSEEVTAFGDGNKSYVVGYRDAQGEFEGWFDDTEDLPYEASESVDGTNLVLYISRLAPTRRFYGPAWVDVSVETPVNSAVKVTGKWKANGTWRRGWN